ncbi:MAG: methyltransferase family protein [Thermodesulfobacteriota bacterium]
MEHEMTLGGIWSITIIMVVIASWILYRYIAPENLKEWRNAGLIQAFIIALYAEMYGFPLTIYFLTSFLGFDIPWLHMNGHLWASLFGWGVEGAIVEMLVGYTFIFMGIFLVVKGWRQVYRAQQEDMLVINGIYRYIRHPQYAGIYLAVFGQLIHWPTIPTLLLFPVIVTAYYTLARREERVMIERFGEDYRVYMERVPMFFPKWQDRENVILDYGVEGSADTKRRMINTDEYSSF